MSIRWIVEIDESITDEDHRQALRKACDMVTEDATLDDAFASLHGCWWKIAPHLDSWEISFWVMDKERFGFTIDPKIDDSILAYRVAERFQDHMIGYERIQWPTLPGRGIPVPEYIDCQSVWTLNNNPICQIGLLKATFGTKI